IVLLPLAIAFEGKPHAVWTWQFVVSFWYVVLVMSVGASLLWFWLLTHGEASRVSAYYFLTPVFGLALAALLLREPVGVRDIGGLIAIALGISLVQRSTSAVTRPS
ncbi:MAG: DMT family transporter, partial [Candidatus Eremiobacteraeota bacterium]|nr:DMT family transporter [Candidatus Eremiobacteraeota bacterium]